ncbi:AN1-type zinc finger protein 1-like [Dendronephthya gigantea]|uniref:AN1-type zinc finger protein 1-like n=1 Tax=Dendronephthya gigantea TaxID=151771 RepID=UPI00106BD561|nr:AN1-type zinc finger protein 1-like [Dendronephthya gigantea]
MAEIEVGKQCSVSSCKQLDFLPFTCNDCSAIFCLEHRSTTSHNCPGNGEAQETKSSSHELSREKSSTVECCFEGCSVRDLTPVLCDHCRREFCLRHRHQPDHSCPKYEEQKKSASEAMAPKLRIVKKEKTGRGGARSDSRAAKVALMKMKLHAVGDASTPQEERVFFSILLPKESMEQKPKPMFFSKKWSIGRIIDQIAKTYKLKNENNQQTSKKLRLFEKSSERQLILGNTLETEMNENAETLFSGSELILRYI